MRFLRQLRQSGIAALIIVALVALMFICGFIPWNAQVFAYFLIGVALLVVGQSVFLVAIDESIIKIGKTVGSSLIGKRKLWLILLFGFLFGLVSTIAEPDVQVLVSQLLDINPFVSSLLLTAIFGLGSGLLVMFAIYRILKNISLRWVLLILYAIILILGYFAPDCYFGLAFDAGGVATGTITVPFLLSLIIGICAMRGNAGKNDSFGAVAITSTGPIIAILIFGIICGEPNVDYVYVVENLSFGAIFADSLKEVALALMPLFVIFIVAQVLLLKTSLKNTLKSFLGVIVAGLGLVVFLSGINFGFTDMGVYIGENILQNAGEIILLIFGFVIGATLVFTDPATIILVKQIEEVTNGFLNKKVVFITLGLGVALAVLITFLHIILSINLWWILVPLYIVMVLLNFFIPKIFTAVAFDSGGIASGTMVVAFILPISIGVCEAIGSNIMLNAFGVVGLVSTMPILTVQILGLIYSLKTRRLEKEKCENE